MNFIKKVFPPFVFVFGLVYLAIVSQSVIAQDSEEVGYMDSPLILEVQNHTFSEASRELAIDLSVENNTDVFVDDLMYAVEIYQGDELAEVGYAFEDLEYITYLEGDLNNLDPSQSVTKQIRHELPARFDSGNYFFRVMVENSSHSIFGMTITEEPLFISGTGGYIPDISFMFETAQGEGFPMEGLMVEEDEGFSLHIKRENNPAFFDLVENNDIKAKTYAYRAGDHTSNVIHEYEEVTLFSEQDSIILNLTSWDGIIPGPYDLRVEILNEQNEKVVSDLFARLLMNGFTARIDSFETGTNSYSQNDLVDLDLKVVYFGENVDSGTVNATFTDSENYQQDFSQNIRFVGGEMDVNFSNYSFESDFNPVSVEVDLIDSENDIVLDTQDIQISQEEVFTRNVIKDVAQSNIIPIIAAIVIILLVIIFIMNRKNKKSVPVAMLLALVLVFTAVFYKNNTTEAKATTTMNFFDVNMPSGDLGTCSKTVTPEVSVRASCSTCLNGLHGDGEVAGSGFAMQDHGHKWGSITWGPFYGSVTVDSSNPSRTYNASASLNAGAHCAAASTSHPDRTVTCTVPNPVNGSCGAAHGPDAPYYSNLTSGQSGLCSSGTVGNFQSQGSDPKVYTWDCQGQHGGSNVSCRNDQSHPFTPVGPNVPGVPGEPDEPDEPTPSGLISCRFNPPTETGSTQYEIGEEITAVATWTNSSNIDFSRVNYSWSGDFGNSSTLRNSNSFDTPDKYYASITAKYEGLSTTAICESDVTDNNYALVSNAPEILFDIPVKHGSDRSGTSDRMCEAEWSLGEGDPSSCTIVTEFGDDAYDLGTGIQGPNGNQTIDVQAGNSYKIECTTINGEEFESGELLECIDPSLIQT